MKLTKSEKVEKSKALAEGLGKAPHLFFTEFQGLKFVELDELRAKLRPLKCRYTVIKNSTVRYALKAAGVDGIDPKLLKGPVGMVVAETDDPVSPAKVLTALSKQYPSLKIKAGFVGAKWMTPSDCQRLATVGTKPELLGKLVGGLYAAVSQSAGVLQAPIRDFVLALKALEDKRSKESGAAAAA
ncbi:MAG: 50S ribosomal protein L10 [Elusimicrobia bacterium]|nr:50S ribosomal protein L10 [Elusimicrobiota bacterium]MDE2426977.1 50S ribosomal protein L10 [Elusimicrobiota bacterium]